MSGFFMRRNGRLYLGEDDAVIGEVIDSRQGINVVPEGAKTVAAALESFFDGNADANLSLYRILL